MDPRPVIMIAENNPDLRWLYQHWLEDAGFFVRPVEDGAWALAEALPDPPDLLLVDLELPHVDGFEVCRRMRATGASRPLILATCARPDRIARIRAECASADCVLLKPFGRVELITQVERILGCAGADCYNDMRKLEQPVGDGG